MTPAESFADFRDFVHALTAAPHENNYRRFARALRDGAITVEAVHAPAVICPDCGKNIAFRGRCPKCGGNSWIPAGHAGGRQMHAEIVRLRQLLAEVPCGDSSS
jgi:hypothetical protein